MNFGKKSLCAMALSVLSLIIASNGQAQINTQPLGTISQSLNRPNYCFGLEASFVEQYFSTNGSHLNSEGMRPGFGINFLAEYGLALDGDLLATIEPGLLLTSGKYEFKDNSMSTAAFLEKHITGLNIPVTLKYRVYDLTSEIGFFVQAGIVPGFILSQNDSVTKSSPSVADAVILDKMGKNNHPFYLGGMLAIGATFDVLPSGSLQARLGWQPNFTAVETLENEGDESLKQNFLFIGVAYKFCK